MTLKEAYKQWSQQKENYELFTKTRAIFGSVWSKIPFHLECSNYSDTDLATYLLNSKSPYGDKVKATSVIIHVLTFGLGKPCGFTMNDVLSIYDNYTNKPQEDKKNNNKPKPDIFKPLKYKDKPFIPQEVPEPKPVKKTVNRKYKPVYQFDGDGKLIKEWSSVKGVSNSLGITESSIYKAICAGFKVKDSFWSRSPELTDIVRNITKPKKEAKVKEPLSSNDKLISQLKDLVNKIREKGIDIKVIINI